MLRRLSSPLPPSRGSLSHEEKTFKKNFWDHQYNARITKFVGAWQAAPGRWNFLKVRMTKVVDRLVIEVSSCLAALHLVTHGHYQVFDPVVDFSEKSFLLELFSRTMSMWNALSRSLVQPYFWPCLETRNRYYN